MTEPAAHRQLLSASKLLLHRLEARCSRDRRVWQPDWKAITLALRAIAESLEALENQRELQMKQAHE